LLEVLVEEDQLLTLAQLTGLLEILQTHLHLKEITEELVIAH
jgi:hypothetical protein